MSLINKSKTYLHKDDVVEETKEWSYSRPHLNYYLDNSDGNHNFHKNSFKMFQAITLGDTSDASHIQSYITSRGSKYKPKIFEILK